MNKMKPKAQSYVGRIRFDWHPDVADHRDKLFAVSRAVAAQVPPFVERLGLSNPIEDQGELGSCTGNAATSAFEIVSGWPSDNGLSRLHAYYNARSIEHSIRQDAGASIRDAVKGLFKMGVARERTWPYLVSKFATKPSKAALTEASQFVAQNAARFVYTRLTTLAQLKVALAAGYPVVFGFSVPEIFASWDGKRGMLEFPTQGDRIIGGHAVVAVGYDDRSEVNQFIWVRNSWGIDYGINGHFKMAQRWFTDAASLADDMWAIKPVVSARQTA